MPIESKQPTPFLRPEEFRKVNKRLETRYPEVAQSREDANCGKMSRAQEAAFYVLQANYLQELSQASVKSDYEPDELNREAAVDYLRALYTTQSLRLVGEIVSKLYFLQKCVLTKNSTPPELNEIIKSLKTVIQEACPRLGKKKKKKIEEVLQKVIVEDQEIRVKKFIAEVRSQPVELRVRMPKRNVVLTSNGSVIFSSIPISGSSIRHEIVGETLSVELLQELLEFRQLIAQDFKPRLQEAEKSQLVRELQHKALLRFLREVFGQSELFDQKVILRQQVSTNPDAISAEYKITFCIGEDGALVIEKYLIPAERIRQRMIKMGDLKESSSEPLVKIVFSPQDQKFYLFRRGSISEPFLKSTLSEVEIDKDADTSILDFLLELRALITRTTKPTQPLPVSV